MRCKDLPTAYVEGYYASLKGYKLGECPSKDKSDHQMWDFGFQDILNIGHQRLLDEMSRRSSMWCKVREACLEEQRHLARCARCKHKKAAEKCQNKRRSKKR